MEKLQFCGNPLCTARLKAHEYCPKDGEGSVTAAEKLVRDSKALQEHYEKSVEELRKGKLKYVCMKCNYFSDDDGKCPAGHKLQTVQKAALELTCWYETQLQEAEKFVGLKPTFAPPAKKPITNPKVTAYLAQLMWKALKDAGVNDAVVVNEWQEKSEKLSADEFLAEAKKFPTPLDLTALENYVEATKIETLTETASVKYHVGEEVINAFLPSLTTMKERDKTYSTIATDLNLSYEQIKRSLRQILPEYFNNDVNDTPNQLVIPFIVSKERCLSGQVISNLDGAKKSVNLVTLYSVGGKFFYQFFGEGRSQECKKAPVYARYNELFYVYKFQSDTTEEIILLSPKELELSGCKIWGMEANCFDFLKIGNMAKISTTQKIFFVHSQKPSIETITENKFWKRVEKYDKDTIYSRMFGAYPHPEWFSSFITAWAFSGKLSDMPTHLSLMSPPALGKTKMLENLGQTFSQNLNDGGTIKGLVPSFANGIPKEGYLIKCRRFGFVDEFLHIIQSSARNGSDFDGGSFALLKVLEHSEGEHSSAFGVIKAKPKMWVIFCSNIRPYEHIKNLVDLHEKLNVAFMSRILWYVYDPEHIEFINKHKSEVMKFTKEKSQPKHDNTFVSLVDYMHTIIIDIPIKVVEDIHAKYRCYVPAPLELDIYDSRMIMHIYRMLDGYGKYKSVIEKRGKFILTEEDIKEADEIIGRIIKSWSQNLDSKHMTPAMKISYLGRVHREIYDFIKINQYKGVAPGVDEHLLTKLKGVTSVQIATELVQQDILKVVLGSGCRIFLTHDASV